MSDANDLRAILRNDINAFLGKCFYTLNPGVSLARGWHIEAIAHHLEECRIGRIKRLIITVPPRHLKSITASVAFPAYLLGRDPSVRIVCASYGDELATKLGRDCRLVLESEWYKWIFPATRIAAGASRQADFETTQRGGRLSTSVGGPLTGRGGDVIIVDDAHKPAEALSDAKRKAVLEWYGSTLVSRLNDKREGVIIVIQQRVHENDLVGHLLEQGGWHHLNLPAIAEEDEAIEIGGGRIHHRKSGDVLHPAKQPKDVLKGIERDMGSYAFAAQYQQRPVPIDGGLVKLKWLRRYSEAELRSIVEGAQIFISWDTAVKAHDRANYSVATVWARKNGKYYLLQVIRERLEYPELKKKALALHKRYKATKSLIEDASAGSQLLQELYRELPGAFQAVKPSADKATRLMGVTPIIEAGNVFLPESAPWLAEFEREISYFPSSKYDDQVDSVSQYLEWQKLHGRPTRRIIATVGS